MRKQLSNQQQFAIPLGPERRDFVIETLSKSQRVLLCLSRVDAPRQLRKLCRHRRVAPCELLDRQVVGVVVGESQIVR